MNNWNSLPDSVVNAESVVEFERKIDIAWVNEEQKFDYTAKIGSLDHRFDHMTTRSRVRNPELESQA